MVSLILEGFILKQKFKLVFCLSVSVNFVTEVGCYFFFPLIKISEFCIFEVKVMCLERSGSHSFIQYAVSPLK